MTRVGLKLHDWLKPAAVSFSGLLGSGWLALRIWIGNEVLGGEPLNSLINELQL
jgi:hypothetical protein